MSWLQCVAAYVRSRAQDKERQCLPGPVLSVNGSCVVPLTNQHESSGLEHSIMLVMACTFVAVCVNVTVDILFFKADGCV